MHLNKLVLLGLLLLVGCERPAFSQQQPAGSGDHRSSSESVSGSRRTAITRAVESASPAVVSVNVIEVRQLRYRDPFAGFFGQAVPDRLVEQQVQGLGSGFVISSDGYIVTNDHVAGNATKITVAFPDGSQKAAELIGSDPETDIALIKVETSEALPFLGFENAEDAIVGEWAIALGNPFGLFEAAEPSVTVGVVSGIGRDFPAQQGRTFRDMIQTDAAINSGNSGGPLVDATGRVLGMNTFIFSRSGGSVGIGFAVPSWRIQQVVAELRANGKVNRDLYTGLDVVPLSQRMASILNMPDPGSARGLIVSSVDPDSPADQAGLRAYDVIVAIGGEPVASNEDVRQRLVDNRAGDTISLGIVRDGTLLNVSLTLGSNE